jgi:hypothetical protein
MLGGVSVETTTGREADVETVSVWYATFRNTKRRLTNYDDPTRFH